MSARFNWNNKTTLDNDDFTPEAYQNELWGIAESQLGQGKSNAVLNAAVRELAALENKKWRTPRFPTAFTKAHVPVPPLRSNAPAARGAFGSVRTGKVTEEVLEWMKSTAKMMSPKVQRSFPRKGSFVAIKTIIPTTVESHRHFMNRCLSELYIQSMLSMPGNPAYPYVPRLYFGGIAGRRFILVMERVAGKSVDEIRKTVGKNGRKERLTLDEYERIVTAQQALEKAGVHHGDLSPGNIFLDRKTKKVTIIDFGSAVFYGRGRSTPPIHHLWALSAQRGQVSVANKKSLMNLRAFDVNTQGTRIS